MNMKLELSYLCHIQEKKQKKERKAKKKKHDVFPSGPTKRQFL